MGSLLQQLMAIRSRPATTPLKLVLQKTSSQLNINLEFLGWLLFFYLSSDLLVFLCFVFGL